MEGFYVKSYCLYSRLVILNINFYSSLDQRRMDIFTRNIYTHTHIYIFLLIYFNHHDQGLKIHDKRIFIG